jgi:DNA topoisomerase-3
MTLYITEKPSQVEALRDALKKTNMYNGVEIVPLAGHIMQLYDFEDYDKSLSDSWINLVMDKKVPFFPKELKKKIKPKSSFIANGKKITSDYKKKFDDIKDKISRATKIILATDPDNEGATLGLEVIEKCNALSKVQGMINMSKLDITSLSKEVSIMNKLPYMNMYYAGDSRAYFDQTFGINMSIIATVVLGKGNTLQVGGVKLPTIRMVVERDLAFESHKEIPYWTLKAKATYNNQTFDIDIFLKDEEKFDKEEDALKIKSIVEGILQGKVKEFKAWDKTEAPPKPYSLTDLQSESNKRFKLSADNTLKIAQKLYADYKIQSYPRTDSNYYAEGEYESVSDILTNLSTIDTFKELVSAIANISKPMKRKIFDDSKIDAHTALAPTLEASIGKYSSLNDMDKKIFNLVAIRYIIQFLDDYKYLDISGNGVIEDRICFKFSENVTKEKGWKISMDFTPVQRTIPTMKEGDIVKIDTITITKGTTKPKPRFTESSLLKAMEKVHRFFDDEKVKAELGENGIGTPATRAIILEQLKMSRKNDMPYFEVDKKGTIKSTQKARDLIKVLPEHISSPILRANMESKLKEILKGKYTKEAYFKEVQKVVSEINQTILGLGTMPTQKIAKKEAQSTELRCPLCQSSIVDTGMVYKCEKQNYSNGKVSGCKFSIFKQSKPLGRDISLEDLTKLLKNEEIEGNSGNIKLDLENKYFTSVSWNESSNTKSHFSNTTTSELVETSKVFKMGEKIVFKDFRGKDLTKTQAESLLNGKTIKVKRKSKAGKDYTVAIQLEDNNGRLKVEFA